MRQIFTHARDGNVAMIFALCLVPMLLLMGGALDLSRQRGGEVNVQNALDATLLAVAHKALDLNEDQLSAEGRKWFDSQMMGTKLEITSFTIINTGDRLTAEVTGTIDTSFLAIMGLTELTIRRRASVKYGVRNIEIALVLDTTGSMAATASGTESCGRWSCTGGKSKLVVLKEAATSMMNTLEASGSGQMKVSIIPFATFVNVGPENSNAKWIDTDGKSPVSADNFAQGLSRLDMFKHLGKQWKGCVMTRPDDHDVNDSRPKLTNPETLFVPHFNPDEPDKSGWNEDYPNNYVADAGYSLGSGLLDIANPTKYGVPSNIITQLTGTENILVNGVLLGRDDCLEDYDDDNGFGNNNCPDPKNTANWTPVKLNTNYQFFSDVTSEIGPGFSCEMSPITPLTNDFDKLRTQINNLVASGSTNITEGIMWGWRALSPGQPFNEGSNYSSSVDKVIVLLSDGNNMIVKRDGHPGGSDFSAYGYIANKRLDGIDEKSSQTQILNRMDELTLEACSNIKAKNIRIYSIRLDLTDARSEKVLSSCATDASHFIDAKNTEELIKAFETVTNRITRLHLTE